MPSLPRGAVSHLEHPVVVDDAAFREATGFRHRFDEYETMHDFARGPA
jgi:UDP-glucose 4-epimerase